MRTVPLRVFLVHCSQPSLPVVNRLAELETAPIPLASPRKQLATTGNNWQQLSPDKTSKSDRLKALLNISPAEAKLVVLSGKTS